MKRVAADMAVRTKHERFGRIRLVSYAGYKGDGPEAAPNRLQTAERVGKSDTGQLITACFQSLLGHEAYNRRHSLSAFLSPAAVPVPISHQSTSGEGLVTWRY